MVDFQPVLHGKWFLWLTVYFPVQNDQSEKGSTLEEKNIFFFWNRTDFLHLELTLTEKEDKILMTELPSLQVYPLLLNVVQ